MAYEHAPNLLERKGLIHTVNPGAPVYPSKAPVVPPAITPPVAQPAVMPQQVIQPAQPVQPVVTAPQQTGLISTGDLITDQAAAFKTANEAALNANYVANVGAPPEFKAREVTENETVASQLNKLLAGDSKYIQQARSNAMATANDRGLLNSSIAAGAGEKAAIEAGLPIAQADAATYANSGLSAQNATQEGGLMQFKSLVDSALQKEQYGYALSQNEQQALATFRANEQNIQGNKDLQELKTDNDLALASMNNAAAMSRLNAQGGIDMKKIDAQGATQMAIAEKENELKLVLQEESAKLEAVNNAPGVTNADGTYTPGGYAYEAKKSLMQLESDMRLAEAEKGTAQAAYMDTLSAASTEAMNIQMQPKGSLTDDQKATALANIQESARTKVEGINMVYEKTYDYTPATYKTPAQMKAEADAEAARVKAEADAVKTPAQSAADQQAAQWQNPSDYVVQGEG